MHARLAGLMAAATLAGLIGLAAPARAVDPNDERLVTYLRPAEAVRTQSSVFAGSRWWSVQALDDGTGAEDLAVTRMTARGDLVDSMRLHEAGHGSQVAVQVDGADRWVWVGWPVPTGGTVLARARYQPGTRVTLDEAETFPSIVAEPGGTMNVALDGTGQWLAVRVVDAAGVESFTRRSVAGVVAGVDAPAATVTTGPLLSPYVRAFQYQGHALDDTYLYRLAGMTDTAVTINRYDWSTGQLVDSRDVSQVLPAAVSREPEGMTSHVDAAGRSMVMFGLVLPRRVGRYPVFGIGDPRSGVCRPESHAYVRHATGRHPRVTAVVRRVDCARWSLSVRVTRNGRPLVGRLVTIRDAAGHRVGGRFMRATWTRPVVVADQAAGSVSVRGTRLPLTVLRVRFTVAAR